jgi:siroheme decarboxylase
MKLPLEALPADFPITEKPYDVLARDIGITGNELIRELAVLMAEGYIRRIAGMVAHRAVSYEGNAMVVWCVPEDRIDTVGAIMAGFPEISHCYERDTAGYWAYNLYTMVHGKTRDDCLNVIERMVTASGISDHLVLFSVREFKKTSFSVRK